MDILGNYVLQRSCLKLLVLHPHRKCPAGMLTGGNVDDLILYELVSAPLGKHTPGPKTNNRAVGSLQRIFPLSLVDNLDN